MTPRTNDTDKSDKSDKMREAERLVNELREAEFKSGMHRSAPKADFAQAIAAALLAHIRTMEAPGLSAAKRRVTLNARQLYQAWQLANPDEGDEDQEESEMVIFWSEGGMVDEDGDGSSPAGYYAYYSEYPEEGSYFLDPDEAIAPKVDAANSAVTTESLQQLREQVKAAWITGTDDFRRHYDKELLDVLGAASFQELYYGARQAAASLARAAAPAPSQRDADILALHELLKAGKVGEPVAIPPDLLARANALSPEAAQAIMDIRKNQRRMSWLHSSGAVDADGYEWGVFRVKWGSDGQAADVRQTFSDFSDLDAAMGLARAAGVQEVGQPSVTERLQQRCTDWGAYWRAPDAHGVELTTEQATDLLQDALGVEVEIHATRPEVAAPLCPWLDDPKNTEEAFYALAERRGWDTTAGEGVDFEDDSTQECWQAWCHALQLAREKADAAPLAAPAAGVPPPAPAVRMLTDARIDEIVVRELGNDVDADVMNSFARAIESELRGLPVPKEPTP